MYEKLNVKEYSNKQTMIFPPSIGDFIKEDHICKLINELIEDMDLSPFYKKISPVGNPAYHYPRCL